jgi:hypothetical protein
MIVPLIGIGLFVLALIPGGFEKKGTTIPPELQRMEITP